MLLLLLPFTVEGEARETQPATNQDTYYWEEAQTLTEKEKIVYLINQKFTNPEIGMLVAKCESGLKHEGVYGDSGKAYGVFQFHYPTFESFKKTAKMPELDYKDLEDQITLAAWAFDNHLESHWTCYRNL